MQRCCSVNGVLSWNRALVLVTVMVMAGQWIKLAVRNKLSVWRPEPVRRMGLGKSSVRAAQFAHFSSSKAMCGLVVGEMEQLACLGYLGEVSWLMLVSQSSVAATAVGCLFFFFLKHLLYTRCYKRAAPHKVKLKLL